MILTSLLMYVAYFIPMLFHHRQIALAYATDNFKASQYITVINIAAGIVGFVPGPITMAVSISVQVAAGTAKELQTRHRSVFHYLGLGN
jgi:hypothetical protein